MSDSLRLLWLQNTRLPCPSPTSGACSDSSPSSWWCHPIILASIVPFSSSLHSFPALGPFQKRQFFSSGGQSIGVSASASILSMNIQDWFPLGLTGWISLLCKGLSGVVSNTTVQKHQFFSAQVSLWSNSQLYWEYISYTSMKEEYRVHIYNWILFSHEKKVNCAICEKMDETWGHAKWN